MNSTIHLTLYSMTIVMHAISVALYTTVAYRSWRRETMETALKTTVLGACSFAILLSLVFSTLQIEWIIDNKHEAVGSTLSYFWLVFDYLLAVYLISMGQVLNIVALWSRSSGRRHEPIIQFFHHRPKS